MNTDRPRHLKIGSHLLAVADALVEHKDIKSLGSLNDVLGALILEFYLAGEDISLIEIAGYIGEAIDLLKTGHTPAEVKRSRIRRLLDED